MDRASLRRVIYDAVVEQNIIYHERRINHMNELPLLRFLGGVNYVRHQVDGTAFRVDTLIETHFTECLGRWKSTYFGDFLEKVAEAVVKNVYDGKKPKGLKGVDLQWWLNESILVNLELKSATNTTNGSSQKQLETYLKEAAAELGSEYGTSITVESVHGMCRGEPNRKREDGVLKLVGSELWTFLGNDERTFLYLMEVAREAYDPSLVKEYEDACGVAVRRLYREAMLEFGNPDGTLDEARYLVFSRQSPQWPPHDSTIWVNYNGKNKATKY